MASLYERQFKAGGSVWYLRVKLPTGRWYAWNSGIPSRSATGELINDQKARKDLLKIQGLIDAGIDPFAETGDGIEVRSAAEEYLRERSMFWGQRTLPLHENTLRMVCAAVGEVSIAALTDAHWKLIETGFRRGVSVHTLNIDIRNLRAFLRWAKTRYGLDGWKIPVISEYHVGQSSHRDFFDPEESERLVYAATGIKVNGSCFGSYVAFLLLTGLRKREALALRWEHISKSSKMILLSRTKSGRAEMFPILEEVGVVLDRIGGGVRRGQLWEMSMWSGHIDVCWARAVRTAGVRWLKLHNCRDSFAVNHLLEGMPLAVVSRLLRHGDISTTMRNYAGFSLEDISAIMRGGGPVQSPGSYVTAVLRGLGR
ncbi:tyrosine-type recombinase/integrase [bacterium]|nr:tyrosine-type recombinase/integrase [bacterium]